MHVSTQSYFSLPLNAIVFIFSLIFTEEAIYELVDNTECNSTKDIRIQFRIGKEDTRDSP